VASTAGADAAGVGSGGTTGAAGTAHTPPTQDCPAVHSASLVQVPSAFLFLQARRATLSTSKANTQEPTPTRFRANPATAFRWGNRPAADASCAEDSPRPQAELSTMTRSIAVRPCRPVAN